LSGLIIKTPCEQIIMKHKSKDQVKDLKEDEELTKSKI
jgi:hypothetical protein